MIKRKAIVFLLSFIIVFSVMNVIAFDLTNREIDLTKEQSDNLAIGGITDWSYEDYTMGDKVQRCLINDNFKGMGCSGYINATGLSAEEIDEVLDGWEKSKVIQLGNIFKMRQDRAQEILVNEGNVTIK